VEIGGSGVYVLIGHTEIGSTDGGFWGMFESQVYKILTESLPGDLFYVGSKEN